ncbi:MAG TPA: hypothetical protein VER34_13865 [Mycobacterium sp.]|jgi:hypothetical protein|nr:hypothetical protein [Mycobacterium sp.]
MTSNDVYERLGVQQLLAAGDRIGAVKAYRGEANVDLATASRFIESL